MNRLVKHKNVPEERFVITMRSAGTRINCIIFATANRPCRNEFANNLPNPV